MIVIANPRAGAGRGRDVWPFWRSGLQKAGLAHSWHDCATAEEALRLARRAREPVAAVGGDGTVNWIINGLMMSGGQAPFGLLPAGSSSDFCRRHEIPTEKSAALATLVQGRTRPLDVAEACLTGGGGERAVCYFSCGALLSVGVSGGAGWPGRCFSGLAAWRRRSFACYLNVDGERFEFSRADQLFIFKNPFLAAALKLPEAASGLDGRITLLLFHDAANLNPAGLFPFLAERKPLPRTHVFARAFTRASIINDAKLPVEFDGEAVGFTPMEVELKTGLLDLIVP